MVINKYTFECNKYINVPEFNHYPTHLQTAHFFIFPLTGNVNLLWGIWHREHPDGICAVSESLSIPFCELIFMCFKSLKRSRSVSFGVTDKMTADGGLLASLMVNCVLMTAAVPIADKTQTSSLKLSNEHSSFNYFSSEKEVHYIKF